MASKTDVFKNFFNVEIVRKISVISKRGTSNLELNEVRFGDAEPTLNLSVWDSEHIIYLNRGISFSNEEAIKLYEVLKKYIVPKKTKKEKKALKNNKII